MALVFIEGFDKMSASTEVASQADAQEYFLDFHPHLNWSGSQNPQFLTGRVDGSSFSHGNDGFTDVNWWDASLETGHATVIVGFALKTPNFAGLNAQDLVAFWDLDRINGVEHIVLGMEHGANLYVERGFTRLAMANHALQMNRWHYVEIKVTISNTVGVVEVRVNGDTIINLTNTDTNNSGSDIVTMVRFRQSDGGGNGDGLQNHFDDMYVCDGSGSVNNDFLGTTRVETLLPNGAGDSAQFTPSAGSNYENVDDANGNDGDTTYNQSSTSTHLDLFTCEDLTDITGTIHGVQVYAQCRVTDTTPTPIIPKCKSSTTEGTGSTIGIGDTSGFVGVRSLFEQDPDAAAAWTTTTVNAMQIGYEVG